MPLPEFERYTAEPDVDEVIPDTGVSRWVGVVAVLIVLGVLVTALRDHSRHAPSHPASTPTPTRAVVPARPAQQVVYDLASGPGAMWLLEGQRLAQVSDTRMTRSVPLGVRIPVGGLPKLAVDAAAARIWVVLTNTTPSRMIEFDSRTLRRLRDVEWRQSVQSAAAYRGHLYLAADFSVADLAPGARRPRYIVGLGGAVGLMAVDAARDRLVVMDFGYPTNVWTYRPGGRPVLLPVQLPLLRGTLAVVDGAIWVGGFGLHGAVLLRLNPTTLRAQLRLPPGLFGTGALIDGVGSRVLWVSESHGLACLDARTGRIEQTWPMPYVSVVASNRSGAVVATPGGVLGLIMSGCAG